MPQLDIDEESKGLLRRIVERQAFRQMMLERIRGHGLKFVPEIDGQILLAQDIVHSLRVMQQIPAPDKPLDTHVRVGPQL